MAMGRPRASTMAWIFVARPPRQRPIACASAPLFRPPPSGEPWPSCCRWLDHRRDVWSRNEVVRIDFEDCGSFRPGLADDLIGRSPFQGLQVLGEVVGGDEGQDMGLQAVQIVVVEDLDCGVLDGAVHSFDLAVIRYEIIGASLSGCFRKGTSDMVSPSGIRGAGSTKVRAGRR